MRYALSSLFLLALSACGQHVGTPDVPAAVKAAFQKQFPNAQAVKWELEDGKDLEANFSQDGIHWSAVFTPTGEWRGTEHTIKQEDLPAAVQNAIATNYAGHKVKEAEQADLPTGTAYEVELKKGGEEMEVVFSPSGTLIRSRTENGKDGGDED
ncbi:MAG: PepSY-like domain-containing protein [Flavobacteriales bacterium]